MDIEHQNTKPKLKKCVPRFITFIGFIIMVTTGTFVGFSLYTIPQGYVGYVEGNDYIIPGTYTQVPWLPKPDYIKIKSNIIILDNYTTPPINSTMISIKKLHLKYDVEDINAYIIRILKHGRDNYKFSLLVEATNDINMMLNSMTKDEAVKITEYTFKTHVFHNATDVKIVDVIFTTPKIMG